MGIIRKVFGASAIIILANGLNRFFAILAAPLLTRILGPAPYGVMALVGTATSLASTLSLLGIDMSYMRFFFSKENATSHGVETFCWRFAISSSIIVGIIATFSWGLSSGNPVNNNLMIASMVGVTTILFVINTMSQTRARMKEKYRRISLAIILSGICATLLSIILATLWRSDEWPLLVGFVSGILVNILIVGIPNVSFLFKKSGLTVKEKWPIIRLGLPGLVTGTMYWILSSSDRWFLKHFWGEQAVGIYSFAYNVAILGMIVNNAVVLTWFPESIRTYEKDSRGASTVLGEVWGGLTLLLCLVWLIIASIGGDTVRLLADSRFHSGASYVPWIAGSVFFYGMAQLANTGLLISKNMKPAANLWFLGGALNIILNYFAIQTWGAYGAAVTSCFSFAFIYLGVMWKSLEFFRMDVVWRKLLGAGAIVLTCGVLMSPAWHRHPLASICLKLPLCVIVCLLAIRLIIPGWVRQIKEHLDEFRIRT